MVTFTQIPEHYTPLGGEAVYAFENDTAQTVDIRIIRATDDSLLGAKRFASVTGAAFDAAPCLRRAVRFAPAVGGTGVYNAARRQVMATVEAFAEATATTATAPTRIFLPCRTPVQAPAMLTTMPVSRLIAPGECDELTLLFEEASTVTVTAQTGNDLTAQSYRVATAGFYLFRLDTRDFPEAETLTVDAGACGITVYTLVAAPRGAVRLAWRSSEGSVEHYTFPIVRTTTVSTTKTRAYGPDGYLAAAAEQERRQQLVSAYEPQAVLEALSELPASPDVWIADKDRYTPVDVLTEKIPLRRHGTMCCLEMEIRPNRKTRLSWN